MTPARLSSWRASMRRRGLRRLRMNYGVQRSENGGTAVRAIAMLPALTGAWKYRGGGGSLSTSGAFAWNKRELERLDLALDSPLGRQARIVNMSTLGQALTGTRDRGTNEAMQKPMPMY